MASFFIGDTTVYTTMTGAQTASNDRLAIIDADGGGSFGTLRQITRSELFGVLLAANNTFSAVQTFEISSPNPPIVANATSPVNADIIKHFRARVAGNTAFEVETDYSDSGSSRVRLRFYDPDTGSSSGILTHDPASGFSFNQDLSALNLSGTNTGDQAPGGSDTQVQFNDGGSFGGSEGFAFNETTYVLTLGVAATGGGIKATNSSSGAGVHFTITGSNAGSGNSNGGDLVLVPGDNAGSGSDGKVINRPPGGVAGSQEIQTWYDTSNSNGYFVVRNSGGDNFSGMLRWQPGSGWIFGNIGQGAGPIYCLRVFATNAGAIREAGVVVANGCQLEFSPSTNIVNDTPDASLKRDAAGVLRLGDGSTGIGKLKAAFLVEANTAGSGSPNVLTAAESRTVLTNEGATAENYHTLPSAVAGLEFTFVVQDTDGIRVTAAAGDTIQPGAGASVSASGGFIRCATAGASIRLLAINATQWMSVGSPSGTWTVDV